MPDEQLMPNAGSAKALAAFVQAVDELLDEPPTDEELELEARTAEFFTRGLTADGPDAGGW